MVNSQATNVCGSLYRDAPRRGTLANVRPPLVSGASKSLVARPRIACRRDEPKLSVPQRSHQENSRPRFQPDGVAPPCTSTASFRMSCKNGSPHRRLCDEPHRLMFRLWFPLRLPAESKRICRMHCLCGVCYLWNEKQRAFLARRSPRSMPIHKGSAQFGS